ncbi:MAG: Na+/H+ antiporter subunit D [Chlamydiia bacterium]|nr:Na+/H+ antiporter subunit D [Chlamydiia bacterium]
MLASIMVILPFLIPLFGAISLFVVPRQASLVRLLFLFLHLGACVLLGYFVFTEGVLATTAGSWTAPYGIVLIADSFSVFMLVTASLIFLCCLAFSDCSSPVIFFLQAGVSLSFISGDLFNLFVAFELMLMSSYVIMSIYGRPERLGALYSYLSMNIMASFLYLIAIAVFYGYTGSLNFAAIALHFQSAEGALRLVPVLMIVLVMLIKGGLFPFYFWLPDAYPSLPGHLGGLFSGVMSKVAIYELYRLYLTVFPMSHQAIDAVLVALACCTMFLGVLGAVSSTSIRGILSYHTLSQVGYIVACLLLGTPLGVTAGLFFMVHNMVVKSSLFVLGGKAAEQCGSDDLHRMGGAWDSYPFLGLLFLIQALSLAGIPPLSGFWGKYLLFLEGVQLGQFFVVVVAVLTSFMTLFSMVKIWNAAFLGEPKTSAKPLPKTAYLGALCLTLAALWMGVCADKTFALSSTVAAKLLDNRENVLRALDSGSKGERT